VPAPRLTTHKTRSAWFRARTAWPYREPSAHALVRERARAASTLAAHAGAARWELAGPTNVGGRMTSVACAPGKADTIWAGAAGGGVWKSDDGGRNWRPLWHSEPTLNVGSLAVDPANPSFVYCGTGEANLSADSYPGVGVFRSTDGGAHWHILAPAETAGLPTRIGCIAVDPFDSNHICLGGVTHTQGGIDGMFASTDGGMSWTRQSFPGSGPYRCHAIVFHPNRRDTLFATIAAQGSRSGIWQSRDGGGTWKQLTKGLPPPDAMGRASLAISPSDPQVMYAMSENKSDGVLGIFKTVNGGAGWTDVTSPRLKSETQMSYGNTIAVHPADPDHVLCGGVDLHLTRDGGRTWTRVTRWDADRGRPRYAHSDHHCLLMPPGRPGLVYDMNDGGMDVSTDGGLTWSNRSRGLAATMFYDVDVGQSDGGVFGGGAQDNGTIVTTTGHAGDFKEVSGGDGGWIIIDPRATAHVYTTAQNMSVWRHRAGGHWTDVSPPAHKSETDAVWMAFLDMDPNDPRTVFLGGLRVWRTKNDASHWAAVSPVLDGSPITAVEIAQANSKMVYVGTENGGLFRSTDGGNSWSQDLSGAAVPGVTITRILTSPRNAQVAYLTVANFGGSHVFRSNDGGSTWEDIDRGALPSVPHHAIAIPRLKPSTLYVCSDAGVFVSTNAGGSWSNLTRNLPTCPVVDLVYHEADATLTAATYGRSIWRLEL
jgi:photosystem II stability/assembly factor-like uncharacterized protein